MKFAIQWRQILSYHTGHIGDTTIFDTCRTITRSLDQPCSTPSELTHYKHLGFLSNLGTFSHMYIDAIQAINNTSTDPLVLGSADSLAPITFNCADSPAPITLELYKHTYRLRTKKKQRNDEEFCLSTAQFFAIL